MPDIIFIDDSASVISSCNSSIKYQGRLRRQRTVQKLSRWVSKRVSRQYLTVVNDGRAADDDGIYESYTAFCNAFTASGQQEKSQMTNLSGEAYYRDLPASPTICANVHTTVLSSRVGLPPSLSDSPSSYHRLSSNDYDVNVAPDMEQQPDDPAPPPEPPVLSCSISIESSLPPLPASPSSPVYPSRPSSSLGQDADDIRPTVSAPSLPTWSPVPPPKVLTPSLYVERRTAAREKKSLRCRRLWEPIRSLFFQTRSRGVNTLS